jgi:hypothetical protein
MARGLSAAAAASAAGRRRASRRPREGELEVEPLERESEEVPEELELPLLRELLPLLEEEPEDREAGMAAGCAPLQAVADQGRQGQLPSAAIRTVARQ